MNSILKDFNSIKIFLEKTNFAICSIGISPFAKLGLEAVFPKHHIIALHSTADTMLIAKDVLVTTIENIETSGSIEGVKANHSAILSHKKIEKLLNGLKPVILILTKSTKKIDTLAAKNGWLLATSPTKVNRFLENKSNFRQLCVDLDISIPSCKTIPQKELIQFIKKAQLPFVLQYPRSESGRGTFMIKQLSDIEKFISRYQNDTEAPKKVLYSEFILGQPVSTIGIATRWGTFSSNIQLQVIQDPTNNGTGTFVGHDWTAAQTIPPAIHELAISITKKIGREIYLKGHKGFFGIDFIWNNEQEKLLVLECNPRLTGALPTLDLIQEDLAALPFVGIHVLEFLADYLPASHFTLDYNAIQSTLTPKKFGAHIHIRSPKNFRCTTTTSLKPGVYHYKDSQINFIRSGYRMNEIRNSYEFIITELATPYQRIAPHARLCRLLSKDTILNEDFSIHPWVKKVDDYIVSQFHFSKQTTIKKR